MATQTEKMQIEVTAKGVTETQAKINTLNQSVAGMAKSIGNIAIAYVGFRSAISLLSSSYKAWEDQNIAIKQFEATLASTGRQAEITSIQMQLIASNMQKISNYADEVILSDVMTTLLRFSNITAKEMDKATKATLDLASATGMDLKAAAEVVGRALEKPSMASRQLRSANVILSASEQKLIKDFEAAGNMAAAQQVIIDRLAKSYKGLTEASIRPLEQMKNAWGELQEAIGGTVGMSIGEVFGGGSQNMLKVSGFFTDWITNVNELTNKMGTLGKTAKIETTKALLEDLKAKQQYMTEGGGFFGALYDKAQGFMLLMKKGLFYKRTAADAAPYTIQEAINLGNAIKELEKNLVGYSKLADDVQKKPSGIVTDKTSEQVKILSKDLDGLDGQLQYHYELMQALSEDRLRLTAEKLIPDSIKNVEWKSIDETTASIDAMAASLGNIDPLVNEFGNELSVMEQAFVDLALSMKSLAENEIASALNTIMLSTESASEKLRSIWKSLASAIISEINRVIARMLVLGTINAFTGGAGGFFGGITSAITGLFNSTGGSNINPINSNVNPIGERSISRDIRNALASQTTQQPEIKVYVDPRQISRAAEIGTTLRYTNA